MANLNLTTVELVSTLRAAPSNGPTNSQDYNDSWTEALADLASLSGFINDIVIPMLNGLNSTIQPLNVTTPSGIEGRFIFSDTSDLTPVFFDSLSNQSLTIAESLRVLNGIVAAVQTTIGNLNVEVTALQTQLSATNQNDLAQALQNITTTITNLTNQVNALSQLINSPAATFGASGPSHAPGDVPDPGPVAGTARYLREDATWDVPPGTGGGGSGPSGPIITVVATYATLVTDFSILGDSATPITITLTTTGIIVGKLYRVKNINAGLITVAGETGNIDNSPTFFIPSYLTAVEFQWDGTNWWIF